MPSNKNLNNISVGSGQAAQNTVPASALITLTLGGGGSSTATSADLISSTTPLAISGNTVQKHIDGISFLAPRPLPFTLAETYFASQFTLTPTFQDGFIAGTTTPVIVFNANSAIFELAFFPADRGVLAVEFDTGSGYQAVQALNLDSIFVEGDTEALVAPSRAIGQNDYPAGSNPAGSVGALPQNIDVVDRLPRLTDYTRANFPFLGPGPDPVYTAFNETFQGQQLGRLTYSLSFSVGSNGPMRFVHYDTLQDFNLGQAGSPFSSISLFSFSGNAVFYDNSAVPVSITSYTFTVNNLTDSVAVGAARRYLSGILHYAPVDTFDVAFTATGMYANTYSLDGARLVRDSNALNIFSSINYLDYAPSPTPNIGDGASYLETISFSISSNGASICEPEILAFKPNGSSDLSGYAGQRVLIHEGDYGLGIPTSSENFKDEQARYLYTGDATTAYSANGAGTTWNNQADISTLPELQIRAVDLNTRAKFVTGGGELTWPELDYSSGYLPSTRDGVNPQYDYSSLTPFDRRGYVRAFNVGSPRREGRIQLTGTFLTPTYTSLGEMLLDTANSGVDISLAANGSVNSIFQSILKPFGQGGIYTDFEEVDDNNVIITYQLAQTPLLINGFYTVAFQVTIEAGSPATSGGTNFGLQNVQILPFS